MENKFLCIGGPYDGSFASLATSVLSDCHYFLSEVVLSTHGTGSVKQVLRHESLKPREASTRLLNMYVAGTVLEKARLLEEEPTSRG